jgi:hypothetical protein
LDALLRELQGISATPGRETLGLIASCIAQAEAQEGQAGELSDEVIDRIGVEIETELVSADWSPVSVAVEVENFKRYARRLRPYLNPSQAIGEQTPVALDDRTFIALFAKVKCEFCEDGKDEGRTCATCHGLGMRDPDLYELRSRMRNLYRSPISPEARDRAIEALERIRELSGQAMLDDAKGGFGTPFVEIRTKAGKALSALRGS